MQESDPSPSAPSAPVLGYASISTRDGRIINEEMQGQAEQIAKACARLGLDLIRVVSEREPSRGSGLGRPGLEYVLKEISSGRAKGLVVSDLSRLTASAAQLGAILEWFVEGQTRLVAVSEGIDTAESSGRLTARTLIRFSNRERERLLARTRGLQVARSKGGPPRRPSVNDDAELRERIRRMREQNMSLQAIADRLNAEGVPTVRGGSEWRPSSLQSVFGYKRRRPELDALLREEGEDAVEEETGS